MYDPHDPRLLDEEERRLGRPHGPDSSGGDMARSIIVLALIVVLVLGGMWLAGA